ncbi:MAG TPA: methylthioribulose 1-phosphate dehydratase [Gemmatimonadaceae bacterium]|jgi:methylthioribulose-1-phosphate dehydratase
MSHSSSAHASSSPRAGAARELAAIGRRFYARGWVLGTSGNFSSVTADDPLRLAITASSVHKGELRSAHILEVDESGRAVGDTSLAPSAETLLHVEIVRRRKAAAVLHTHSVWGTILSDCGHQSGIAIEGFEMLKGLGGVRTHEHREWIPIVDNDQDMVRLASVVGNILDAQPTVHAVLLRRHGLYTWGSSLADAERHVEILEFLFETIGRRAMISPTSTQPVEETLPWHS